MNGSISLKEFEQSLFRADISNKGRVTGVDWEFFFNVHVSAICSESDWDNKDVIVKRKGQVKPRKGPKPALVTDDIYQQTVKDAF